MMRLTFALSALLISAVANTAAHADPVTTSYDITTTQVLQGGPVTGTITGYGTTLTSFDIVAADGSSTFTFDSQNSIGTLYDEAQTYQGQEVYRIYVYDDYAFFGDFVVGNFTDGFTDVNMTQGSAAGAILLDGSQDQVALDYTSPSATPEPSSIALLATGLLGLAGLIKQRSPEHRDTFYERLFVEH
jgi:hypothetical protein